MLLAGCSSSDTTAGSTAQVSQANPNLPPAPPGVAVARVGAEAVKSRTVTTRASGPSQISLQPGWNLFSMPFSNPTTFIVDQPASVLSCYYYDTTTEAYVAQTFSQAAFTQQQGAPAIQYQGYWVFCSTPVQLTLDGVSNTPKPSSTSLLPGWNLVGTPVANDAPATEFLYNSQDLVSASTAGLLGSSGFTYSTATGAYQPLSFSVGAFPAFQAAWIFAFQPGTLTGPPALTGITLTSTPTVTNNLTVGGTATFTATGAFADGSTGPLSGNFTFNTSNSTVGAAPGANSVFTALALGTTNITVTQGNVTSNAIAVTVITPVLTGITLTSAPTAPASISVGNTVTFVATGSFSDGSSEPLTGNVTFTSSNPATGTAPGSNGIFTALAIGSTNITATQGNITSNQIAVGVIGPQGTTVTSVALEDPDAAPPAPGGISSLLLSLSGEGASNHTTFFVIATLSDGSQQSLTTAQYSSSNSTVGPAPGGNGVFTATATGATNITAVVGNQTLGPIQVNVLP